ncbi:DPP IV N-terminal domain-containing protein [Dyadobacter jejuensis]|nr:DPP IV N-terminal domain-containing protein [Dyadobacter jejuensis]
MPKYKSPFSTVFIRQVKLFHGLCLILFSLGNNPASASVGDTTQVRLVEGTNMAIAVSPDGQQIAMDVQGTIWVVPRAGGKAKPITDGMGDDRQPSWSVDGKRVAFQSFRDGYYHIWAVNSDGTGLEQLTRGVFDEREPQWSPDGKSLLFSSDRAGNYDIWKMNLETFELTQLTTDLANDYCPAYSSNGDAIAFVSERTQAPGIYQLTKDGKETLLAAQAGKLYAPSWNPDGTHVYFNAFTGSSSSLLDIDVKQQKAVAVTPPEEDVFPFRTSWLSGKEFVYSADGKIKKKIVGKKDAEIIPFEALVTVTTPNYTRKPYDFDKGAGKPVKGIKGLNVSPDGTKYLFSALGDIWMLKKGETVPTPLTNDPYLDADPTWSPDGKTIAFLTDRTGQMTLWLHDVASGEQKELVKLDYDLNYPSWSPDGTRIAFYMGDSRNSWGMGTLQAVDVKTKEITKLHDALFVPSQPSWSPDGKTIALSGLQVYSTRFREGINKIMLVSLEGEPDRYVSPVEERSLGMRAKNGPAWSPDGKSMAYVQDGSLWVIAVDRKGGLVGPPRRLTNELTEVPSWTADSKTLVYMATDSIKQIRLSDGAIEAIPLTLNWDYKAGQGVTVVHAGKVFDGKNDRYLMNMDLIVKDNRIQDILPHKAGRAGNLVDASNKTVIPGLFEMHTHQHAMTGEKLGRLWLSFGITSLRETGADPYDALERKESWDSGSLVGPREFFTGGLTDGSRIYYGLANSIHSTAQLDMELERSSRLGYDMIKTYVRMPDILQQRITAFAHAHGIPVSSHEIFPAMRYGVDQVEHIGGTSRRGYSPKITAMNHTYQDVLELLKKSQMNITPTASLQGGFYAMAAKNPSFYDNVQFNTFYTPEYISIMKNGASTIEKRLPGYLKNFGQIQKTVKKLIDGGARVTAGTDSPFIPYAMSLHSELQCWVDGGITPFQALRSATIWSAEAVGVSKDLGSLEKGKLADLVIVDGDPLKKIEDAWNIQMVMKNGILYTLDQLLKRP